MSEHDDAQVTGGAAVIDSLVALGVRDVFGIPGTHNLELYRYLPESGIRHVVTRHEQGAGYAADGYARVSGRPGVIITTSGPGITNAITALATAYADSVPVLAVSPGPPRGQGRGGRRLAPRAQEPAGSARCGLRSQHPRRVRGRHPRDPGRGVRAVRFGAPATGAPRGSGRRTRGPLDPAPGGVTRAASADRARPGPRGGDRCRARRRTPAAARGRRWGPWCC